MIMTKIKTSEEVKEALNDAAEYLANVPYASKNLLFVADSIKKYLESHKAEEPTALGQEKKKPISLDRAFGLTLGKGKYKRADGKGKYTKANEEKHILMIRKAIEEYVDVNHKNEVVKGKHMNIIDGLNGKDEKEFKILFDRYLNQALESLVKKEEPF
jgi:hypothetical protein